ncbi:hypothetical protein PoB_005355900 [Plakobranchus ocellatus]|uniref:Uncharacterized protein n=1 Tax=Plakobranchus ocellatus TaxID=259542 RepID=A0AAV4C7L0_9GAST|nr:hypothetical protein PoB_005355900 [Plakobranchus ocellatus]
MSVPDKAPDDDDDNIEEVSATVSPPLLTRIFCLNELKNIVSNVICFIKSFVERNMTNFIDEVSGNPMGTTLCLLGSNVP